MCACACLCVCVFKGSKRVTSILEKSGIALLANEIGLFNSDDPEEESKEVNDAHHSVTRVSYTHTHTHKQSRHGRFIYKSAK